MWNEQRYDWSPGYWAQGRADWDWMPAHYVWSPRGYIYVDGYWDYSVQRRGMLFAPVYFDSGLYARSGYQYSPSIVLDLALFAENLFLRPNYHHYYFGDYYDRSYSRGGYFASYAYQNNRHGYDPIYSHQRWEHRQDQGWNHQMETNYQYRVAHEDARPPRTWAAMRSLDASTADSNRKHMRLAAPLDQVVKRKDGAGKYQAVAKADQQMLAKRGQEVQQSREARRTLEATGGNMSDVKPREHATAVKVKQPRSTIVGQSASQFNKKQAPPAALRSPKASVSDAPKSEVNGRQPKLDENNRQATPRKIEATPRQRQAPPERSSRASSNNGQRSAAPPAKSRSVSSDAGDEKSGKKDKKKDSNRN